MSTVDEIVALEAEVKKLKFSLTEAEAKVRKAKEQISNSEKRLANTKSAVVFCKQQLKASLAGLVVELYQEGKVEGPWLKMRKLYNDNCDLVSRIQVELGKLRKQLVEAEAMAPDVQVRMSLIDKKLQKFGQVVRLFDDRP